MQAERDSSEDRPTLEPTPQPQPQRRREVWQPKNRAAGSRSAGSTANIFMLPIMGECDWVSFFFGMRTPTHAHIFASQGAEVPFLSPCQKERIPYRTELRSSIKPNKRRQAMHIETPALPLSPRLWREAPPVFHIIVVYNIIS